MKYRTKHDSTNNRKQIVIIVLILLLLTTIGITVWALFFRDTTPTLAPDYAPQEIEDNAEPIEDDNDDEKLQQQQGGGAVSLTYSREVSIDLSDNIVILMFANPSKSNQDMILQIVIEGTAIVQSGLLEPGYQVTKLDLLDNAELSNGTYDGKFVVLYYQKDTREKAMLNTEIPITISVKE